MKGVILAGGQGTRLFPLTKIYNKHILPVFNKPMIHYPLSLLMLVGIRDFLIITNKKDIKIFKKVLGNGKKFGIKIQYKHQPKPEGISQGFNLAKKFISKSKQNIFILGDNFFYGESLSKIILEQLMKKTNSIFLYKVKNPWDFGNVKIKNNKIETFEEKSKKIKNGLAVTGLYIFNDISISQMSKIKKSKRGEYEITDFLNILNKTKLNYSILGRGITWLDMGTFENLFETSNFIKLMQKRQGYEIGDLVEISKNKKWI